MINPIKVTSTTTSPMLVKSKRAASQIILDTVKDLGIDMKVAQGRLRDAKMSGINLKNPENIKKVVTGDFKSQIVYGVDFGPEKHGFDTVSFMEGNKRGHFQQYANMLRAKHGLQ